MGLIEDELKEVRQLCEKVLEQTKLITCVQEMVRVEIALSPMNIITLCIQFPKNYPTEILLLELKSKTLSERLLKGLTVLCEKNLKDNIGKPQVMKLIKFVHTYLLENPLCCCYDEINNIKNSLKSNGTLRIKQKSGCINLEVLGGKYELKMKITVPKEYPNQCIKIEEYSANFPEVFNLYLSGQFFEIARQCVEPPLRKTKKQERFQVTPSLEPSVKFIIETVLRFPKEKCPVCKVQCLPDNPADAINSDKNPKHVERALCGHLYHQECLTSYLTSPPFHRDGKLCLACPQKLQHQKWGISTRLAEVRWAHQQARERELDEVRDFLQ
uniref:RWD domain-containing protein n=1 Tax=Xenopsylla cheopis TaxID=163159 RepID=A0A6M2DNQ6_XENCH